MLYSPPKKPVSSIYFEIKDSFLEFNAVWVSQPLCSLSQDAKQQAADYANAFHAGKYPVPHSRDEFMAQIKQVTFVFFHFKPLFQYIPLVYPTAESVLAEAVRRWNALTSNGAKDFIAKVWERAQGIKRNYSVGKEGLPECRR